MVAPSQHVALTRSDIHAHCRCHGASHRPAVLRVKVERLSIGRHLKGSLLNSRFHARMSSTFSPVKRAAAGITSGHSRLSIAAASAVTAGALGAAGFAVGSAPWSNAAADAAKTVHSGSQSTAGHSGAVAFDAATATHAQLDALHAATADGGPVHGAGATRQPSHAAAGHAAKPAQARHPAVHPARQAVRHPARQAARHAATRPARRAVVQHKHFQYPLYDAVTPGFLPHGKIVAVYANGAYTASGSQVAGHKSVLWIDTNGSNPGATVLDVEPGDATPAAAAAWVQQRLIRHPSSVAIVYTMKSSWQEVKNHVAHLPQSMQHKVRYWIADPTGVAHMVPGADATQWYWGTNLDISIANQSLTHLG